MTLRLLRLRLIIPCTFATFVLFSVQAHAQLVTLSCKISRYVLDGKDRPDDPDIGKVSTLVFDEKNQTLRFAGERCSGVDISDDIHGNCAGWQLNLDRTEGQLHLRGGREVETGCGHFNHSEGVCDEKQHRMVYTDKFGQCQKQRKNKDIIF